MSFADRLFKAGQDVYQRIENGTVTDVEAELMDAHLNASTDTDEEN
ncbi:hypothetical protein [Streptomyces spinosus]|nr:hypothetical protein [Streptomyces spinosus]